jgi:hypothetical protein
MSSYSEKLQHPKWQKKRLEILDRDGFKCQLCMNENEQLVVHHKKYVKGKEPWDYDADHLITLCKSCHDKHHGKKEKMGEDIYRWIWDKRTIGHFGIFCCYLSGFNLEEKIAPEYWCGFFLLPEDIDYVIKWTRGNKHTIDELMMWYKDAKWRVEKRIKEVGFDEVLKLIKSYAGPDLKTEEILKSA